MTDKGIVISEKHGLNPSLALCYWCGEPSGAVVLCGRLKGDERAPATVLLDYEPCDTCRGKWGDGVVFIETTPTPNLASQPAIQERPALYPTGRLVVVKRERLEQKPYIIQPETMRLSILKQGRCFIEPEAWRKLGFDALSVGGA